MRNLLPICAGLLVVTGIVSVTLWRDLRAERQASSELRTRIEQTGGAALPTPSPDSMPQAAEPVPVITEVETPESISPEAAPIAKAVAQSGLMSTDAATTSASRLEMLKDPVYRAARLAQIRAAQVDGYPGLKEELGLDDYQAEQLFDLLAELQLNTNMESNALIASGADEQTAARENARIQQEARSKRQQALTAMLGTEKLAQWQQYQGSLPARNQATTRLTNLFNAAGQTTTSAQLQPVVGAMLAEQRRQREELQPMFRNLGGMDAAAQAQLQNEVLNKLEQSNNRVIDAAAAHLNSAQLAALRSNLEQEILQAREGMRQAPQQVATP